MDKLHIDMPGVEQGQGCSTRVYMLSDKLVQTSSGDLGPFVKQKVLKDLG